MTGSDTVVEVRADLTLNYVPDFSSSYKQKRINLLPIRYNSVIIGDPIDKPHKQFFDLVIGEVSKIGSYKKDTIVFIGDSPRADCEMPEKLGYKSILIKRP